MIVGGFEYRDDIIEGEEKNEVLPFRVKPDINVRTPYTCCCIIAIELNHM